jgi:NAD-dependent DNA ligase
MGRFDNLEFEIHDPAAAKPEPKLQPKRVRARFKGKPESAFKEPTPTPAPRMPTVGRSFAFTGKLRRMSRTAAKSRIMSLGGTFKSSVSRDLDYLVVGDNGSPLFSQGTKGSKILTAEKLIGYGAALQIISEGTFCELERE